MTDDIFRAAVADAARGLEAAAGDAPPLALIMSGSGAVEHLPSVDAMAHALLVERLHREHPRAYAMLLPVPPGAMAPDGSPLDTVVAGLPDERGPGAVLCGMTIGEASSIRLLDGAWTTLLDLPDGRIGRRDIGLREFLVLTPRRLVDMTMMAMGAKDAPRLPDDLPYRVDPPAAG